MVDQIQIQEDQVLEVIEVLRYQATGKPGVDRLDNLVPFSQPIGKWEPLDGPVTAME